MKTLSLGLIATALAIFAGCSKNSDSNNQTAACAAGTVCETKINTAGDAQAYFTQLKYQMTGACTQDQSTLRFTWLTSFDRVVVAKDAAGNESVAELNLFLNVDDPNATSGTYSCVYQENVQKVVAPGYWQTTSVSNKKDLHGTWSIDGTKLVLSDLGAADEAVVDNNLGAKLAITGSTLNAALNGQTLSLVLTHSKISKDLKTVAQVCSEGGH